ncbi:MAG TPA: P-loop NTPase [Bryobacteraceae bacterium]|nr:P-loop NTPase [Bryobacteraceae bacterium]
MDNPEIGTNTNSANAHFVLQGKGGVGKSYVSAILAQYFRQKGKRTHCFDTDPVNATFAQYKCPDANHLNILRRGAVHEKRFDDLVNRICLGDGVLAKPGRAGDAMTEAERSPFTRPRSGGGRPPCGLSR